MDNIIYQLNSALQIAILLFLLHQIGEPRLPFFKAVSAGTVVYISVNFVFAGIFRMPLNNMVYNIIRVMSVLVFIFLLYKDKPLRKVIMIMVWFLPATVMEYIAFKIILILFGNNSKEFLIENHVLPFGMMLMSDLLLISSVMIYCIWKHKDKVLRKNISYMAVMIIFTLIHMVSLIFYYSDNTVIENENNSLIQFIYQVLLIILVFIQYYNMLHRQQLLESEENLKHLEAEMKHVYNYYTLADEKFTEISGLRHDMQNQIAAVKQLISEDKNTAKAQEVIEQIQERLSASKKVQFCANPIINAVMTIKMNNIAEHDIDTEIILNDCGNLPFEDYDLCSLFANLFDNAFEACRKLNITDKFIEIKSGIKENYFVLKVRNSCGEKPVVSPDGFPDSDKEEPGHGFGTKIIDAITKKYDGSFSMNYADNIMTSVAVLTLSGE